MQCKKSAQKHFIFIIFVSGCNVLAYEGYCFDSTMRPSCLWLHQVHFSVCPYGLGQRQLTTALPVCFIAEPGNLANQKLQSCSIMPVLDNLKITAEKSLQHLLVFSTSQQTHTAINCYQRSPSRLLASVIRSDYP